MEEAKRAGLRAACVPGVDPDQWARAEALRFEGVELTFAVGVHPFRAHEVEPERVEPWIERLCAAAVGEVGWDRKAEASMERQDEVADAQLELARARDLPVILHVVGCHGHALERLERHGPARGVVHAYSGSSELVGRYTKLGYAIGIGPSVLRAGARRPLEAARAVPDEALLIETDAPDQAAPAKLGDVLARVASTRGQETSTIAELTWSNAAALFGPPSIAARVSSEGLYAS